MSLCSESDLESEIETSVAVSTITLDDTKNMDTNENIVYVSDSELTREDEGNELTKENELTRDNKEPSVGLENQQHTHAILEIHAYDPSETGSVATITEQNLNPLCIQEHSQTETEVEINDICVQESHEPSTSIANKFSQQQGIDVMMAGQENLVENHFDFEPVQNETDTKVEPDGKQVSTGRAIEEEQLSSNTELNQSIDIIAKGFEEQTMESQSSDLAENLERISLNFQDDCSPHNTSISEDLPLQVLIIDEQGATEADINNTVTESIMSVAVDSMTFEDLEISKQQLMESHTSTGLEAEKRNEVQYHCDDCESISDKERQDLLQVEKDSTSEKALMTNQKILKLEISAEEKSLNHPADLETAAGRESTTVVQEVSTPSTKPEQDTNTDIRHIAEGRTFLTPSTSSKTGALSRFKRFIHFRKHHDHEEIQDSILLTKVTPIHAGMDPGATRPQENLSSRDKETSPTHSKCHDALNQLRELVPVKREQVSIKRSRSDEKIHEFYNTCLPDSRSVNTDQPIKHSNDPLPWPHKPYLPTVRFYGMLPTKRKQDSTKISKEELHRRYRHRPPPPKVPTLPTPMSIINESPCAVICETDQPEKSCKTDHSGLSTAPYYEEIDFDNFGIKLSTRDPIAISKHKCAFQETLKKDTSSKSTMERDTLEHSHQSSHTSEIDVQLHSENETVSTIEVDLHSPTRKDRNKLYMNMYGMDESGENSETDEERMFIQTAATPVQSKQLYSTDEGVIDINEVDSVECESMITYTHNQWRRSITGHKLEEPESQMQSVDEKEAAIQPYPPSKDTKEQLFENSDNGLRKCSHDDEDTSDVVGDQDIHPYDESEPELPERGYLEDIGFIVNELGMNLCTLPELPATAYQEKQKVSAYNIGETLTLASEANGGPILSSDENSEDHNGAAGWSACSTDPFYHDQLHASNLESSESGDVYVNVDCPQLETQLTSVSQIRPNSDYQGLYQPLITRRQDAESQYDLAAFRPLNSAPSLQIEKAAKSQEIKQDTDTDTGATSCLHGQPILEESTIYSNVPDALSNHYQPLVFKKQDKDPVYVGLSDGPHQPRTMCTSKVSLSITRHEYEDLEVFPVKKLKASSTCQFKSKEELRKLYRHRQPPKLPAISDSKVSSDFQYTDT